MLHPLRIHPPHYRGEGKTPCRVSSPPACIIQCARSSPHFTRSQQATQTWRGNSPRTIDHLCRGKVRAETKQSISAGTTLRLDAGIVHAGHVGSAVGLRDTGSSRSCPRQSCCRSPRPPCWATLSIQTTIQTCVLKSWASFRPPTTAVAAAAVAAAAAAAVEARKPLAHPTNARYLQKITHYHHRRTKQAFCLHINHKKLPYTPQRYHTLIQRWGTNAKIWTAWNGTPRC